MSLKFTYPGTTFKEQRPLPNYDGTVGVLWTRKSSSAMEAGSRILLLFGGMEQGGGQSYTRQLTAVDVDNRLWWYVDATQWEMLSPRAYACAGIIDNRLFVFGGVHLVGQRPVPLKSFSIAEYTMGHWRWIVTDREYPNNVPDFGCSGDCIPVQGQKKILLTPGLIGRSQSVRVYEHLILMK
jgi:hypothetical protein